jgi:hypothetical protein
MGFTDTWNYLQNSLKSGSKIQYWTTGKGWRNKYFEIVAIRPNLIEVRLWNGNIRKISVNEFDEIYRQWKSLWNNQIQRKTLKSISFHVSYIISIYFWLHCKIGSELP